MTTSIVYVTTTSREDALQIGRSLVERRLSACANVFDRMTSVYHWEGRIEEADEAVLIVKTKTDLVSEVIDAVKSLHSYDCPCAVSWRIEQGNTDYLDWIAKETTPTRRSGSSESK